jgi:hypothetical protein
MSANRCAHCGEQIEFFKVTQNLAADHPYRLDVETFGGWWVHATGPSRYHRSCIFGATIADSIANYAKFGNAKAEPESVCLEN